MPSERYQYESQELFDQYVDEQIDYSKYQEQLNKIIEEEVKGIDMQGRPEPCLLAMVCWWGPGTSWVTMRGIRS